jgi:hypothetical protein
VGALRHKLFLDHFSCSDRHREDCAVQAPVSIAILNGERIDFCPE